MDDGAKAIANLLRRRHRSSPKQPEDFQVQNQKELIDTQTASAERPAFFVRWIGLSGLVVSGLGALAVSLMILTITRHAESYKSSRHDKAQGLATARR